MKKAFCRQSDLCRSRNQILVRKEQAAQSVIVWPRSGPTLTIDNFAPVNSEIYLTYFLAAEGSCENFLAV